MATMTLATTGISNLNTIKLAGEVSGISQMLEFKMNALLALSLKEIFESNSHINCIVWCQKLEDPTFSDLIKAQVQDIYIGRGSYIDKEWLCGMAKEIGFDINGGRRRSPPFKGDPEYMVIQYKDGIVTPCSTDLVHCANPDFGLTDTEVSEHTVRLADELNLLMQERLNSYLIEKFGVGCTVIVNRDLNFVSATTNYY